MKKKVYEGYWDCVSCGRRKNKGRDINCRGCGRPRGDEVRFYQSEDAPEVIDPELLRIAKGGPDWICNHCGGSNRASKTRCKGCGAPRGSSPEQPVRDLPLGSSQEEPLKPVRRMPPEREDYPIPRPRSKRSRIGLGILAALIVVGFIALGFWAFGTHAEELTVTGYEWVRTVEIEHFVTLTQEGWEGELPGDAHILSQRRDIHHYDRVLDHYETKKRTVTERVQTGTETYVCGSRDLGNGFFEDIECTRPVYGTQIRTETYEEPVYRDEPVYRTKYTYEVERWVHARTERAEGEDLEPYWPGFTLAENERESGRGESYHVLLTNKDGKAYRYEAPHEEWLTFTLDDTYQAKVNNLGMLVELEKR